MQPEDDNLSLLGLLQFSTIFICGDISVLTLKAGLVAQSVMSATDTLGHWDRTQDMYDVDYAQGCWHAVITGVGNRPLCVCVCVSMFGYNITPISN